MSAIVGSRPGMEDRWNVALHSQGHAAIFAVYDGHGGSQVSTYLMENRSQTILQDPTLLSDPVGALKRSFATCDHAATEENPKRNPLSSSPGPGSTAVVLLILPPRLFVANVGDSRATFVNRDGEIVFETVDQRPTCPTEISRLRDLGGVIRCVNGVTRVSGILAVSRAFGNAGLKQFIKAEPEVTDIDMDKIDTCIVCSDGVTDVVDSPEAVDFLLRSSQRSSAYSSAHAMDPVDQNGRKQEHRWHEKRMSGHFLDGELDKYSAISLLGPNNGRGAAKRLTTLAKTRHSTDNITALLLSVSKRTSAACGYNLRSRQNSPSDKDSNQDMKRSRTDACKT